MSQIQFPSYTWLWKHPDTMSYERDTHNILDMIPPPSLDCDVAGVHPSFKSTWRQVYAEEDYAFAASLSIKDFDVPHMDDQPQTYSQKHDAGAIFENFDYNIQPDRQGYFWGRSLWLNVTRALATCLCYRRHNKNPKSAPEEGSGFPDYAIPYRILIDFVRSMEVICVSHIKHKATQEDVDKFLEKFDPKSRHSTGTALEDFTGFHEEFKEWPRSQQGTQTDPISLTSPAEEKDNGFQSPSPMPCTSAKQALSPREKSVPTLSTPKIGSAHIPKSPMERLLDDSPKESASTKRFPSKPHIMLTRVANAKAMDYRDVRKSWDDALDGMGGPSKFSLFRSSNIHRLRHFGPTGLGIILKQTPPPKQLQSFISACLRRQGRDSFNRVFRSVSSSGVLISKYDEAYRSPPLPTKLSFEERNRSQRSPLPYFSPPQHQVPPRQPHSFPRTRPPPRRPPPPPLVFQAPSLGNGFQMQPTSFHFQSQINQLQQHMYQLMQMQSQLMQQFQHMQYNYF